MNVCLPLHMYNSNMDNVYHCYVSQRIIVNWYPNVTVVSPGCYGSSTYFVGHVAVVLVRFLLLKSLGGGSLTTRPRLAIDQIRLVITTYYRCHDVTCII